MDYLVDELIDELFEDDSKEEWREYFCIACKHCGYVGNWRDAVADDLRRISIIYDDMQDHRSRTGHTQFNKYKVARGSAELNR